MGQEDTEYFHSSSQRLVSNIIVEHLYHCQEGKDCYDLTLDPSPPIYIGAGSTERENETLSPSLRLSSSVTRTKDKPPFEYLRGKPQGARGLMHIYKFQEK
jgi:hypothetical protein